MPGNQDSAADDAEGEDILPAEPQAAVEPAPEWLVNFRRSEHKRGFYISGDGYGVVFSDRGSDVLVVSCDNLSSAREDTIDRRDWDEVCDAAHLTTAQRKGLLQGPILNPYAFYE